MPDRPCVFPLETGVCGKPDRDPIHVVARPMPSPPYLGEEGTEQFTVTTQLNGRRIGQQKIHDPFAATTVILDWKDLFRGLLVGFLFWGRVKVTVSVRGTHAAERRIMTMNPFEMQRENEEWERGCLARAKSGFAPGETDGYCNVVVSQGRTQASRGKTAMGMIGANQEKSASS